jgi:YggT family protein
MQFLIKATEPALVLTRRLIPITLGGLDFSAFILLLALYFLRTLFIGSLTYLARGGPSIGLLGILALALIEVLQGLAGFFMLLMLARAIVSVVNPSPYNPLVMALYALTEPLVAPLRRKIPTGPGGLDLKAVIVGVVLYLINAVILTNLIMTINPWLRHLILSGQTPRPF